MNYYFSRALERRLLIRYRMRGAVRFSNPSMGTFPSIPALLRLMIPSVVYTSNYSPFLQILFPSELFLFFFFHFSTTQSIPGSELLDGRETFETKYGKLAARGTAALKAHFHECIGFCGESTLPQVFPLNRYDRNNLLSRELFIR